MDFGLGDVFDKINNAIDDWTGQDWLGDAVAFGGAIATGQWDEAVQHGLDLAEDGLYAAGWDDAAEWAKWGSDAVDMGSDLYHGRYNEALRNANRVFGGPGARVTGTPSVANPNSPTADEKAAASAFWTEEVLTNGTEGFMDALLRGDASAKAALKDPAFLQMLQMKRQEETQLIALISNLIKQDDARKMAVIRNISA